MLYIASFLIAIGVFVWLGLNIRPASFPAYPQQQPELETLPLPVGLPTPVERFYRQTYGNRIPLIETAVISGRGSMTIANIPIPIRFRFTHEAGRNFRHDIDLTFFGMPLARGYERYVDGVGYGRTPGGIDEGEGFEQGSNVSLWAEALNWFPSILITDPRVKWQAVDENTALLIAPFGNDKTETFVVRFDPKSGLVKYIEAMKFNSTEKKPMFWVSGTWFEQGKPWLHLDIEETLYNVKVHDYVTAQEK